MKATTVARVVKLVIFCGIVLGLIAGLGMFFHKEDQDNESLSRIYAFHQQPKNSIDVVWIGSSGIYRGWSSVDAYHDYGFTSWAWATPAQPFMAWPNIVKDIQKTQNPSLYVFMYSNMTSKAGTTMQFNEGDIRALTDSLSYLNRLNAIKKLMPYRLDKQVNYLYYALPYLRFHDSWPKILTGKQTPISDTGLKGTLAQAVNFETYPVDMKYHKTDSYATLSKEYLKELNSTLTWIKNENIPALFVFYPSPSSKNRNSINNSVEKIIGSYGFKYINLLSESDKIGIDGNKDFQDHIHLNYWGRTKATNYFAKYLATNYNLPDHRNDPAYKSWDKAYSLYQSLVKENISLLDKTATSAN